MTYAPDETPSPELVRAWGVCDFPLATDRVPWWAAQWLADGMDGVALRTLAGLDGTDSRDVRDLLPDVLVETDARVLDLPAAIDIVYTDLARRHLTGRLSAPRTITAVEALAVGALAADADSAEWDFYTDPPLGQIYGMGDEWGWAWGRSREELENALRTACIEQIHASSARGSAIGAIPSQDDAGTA
ncbi:hypothetical protein DPM19_24635 [Actinomadura craniellae]|uniref:Uncharacterized protein n=1 Tax=Actinomadura craniellae TaxID=2231787 RepID=A0A365H292_9ACTN|nr:hypothetical protein [Actinomadura craniellae]RAY12343.1 hypothetical protein DPM19_24635 [Actinomadura craniellae]